MSDTVERPHRPVYQTAGMPIRVGNVIEYEPQGRWCHDGWAIATERRDGSVVYLDTYWSYQPTVVHPESYVVRFNLSDYDEVSEARWNMFDPNDRQYIPKHTGYHTVYLVRKGAKPDLATQIENARRAVADAELKVQSAQWHLDWQRKELADLLEAQERI